MELSKRLGITEPISLAVPTEYDVMKTKELEKVLVVLLMIFCGFDVKLCWKWYCVWMLFQYLQDSGLYESREEAVRREEVLGRLDQVGKWDQYFFLYENVSFL